MKHTRFLLLSFLACAALEVFSIPVFAKEYFVDAKAPGGGSGTAQSPFKTISDAVKTADQAGGTITIKGGVYRESVTIAKGGTADSPLVLRAGPGERAAITGCEPVTGWKMEGKLAVLISKDPVYELFVREQRQRCARFPDVQSPWTKVTAAGQGDEIEVETAPKLPEGQEKGLCASLFTKSSENFCRVVTNFNAVKKTFPFTVGSWTKVNIDDPIVFYNAIDFIKNPGEWACQPQKDGSYKVVYWPRDPKELEQMQTRRRDTVVTIGAFGNHPCGNVRLEGLEIIGGIQRGISALHVDNLTVSRCVIYNNGDTVTTGGNGIACDGCNRARIESCIVFNSVHGIGVIQGRDNVITGCEIAFNDNDGIDLCGRKTEPDAPNSNMTVDHNYFHHHIYLGHADNSQIWEYLDGLEFHHNLSIIGGQNLMTEGCKNLHCSDSVMLTSIARHIILGHNTVFGATFRNMTLMFGNYGSLGASDNTTGVEVFNNVFYENRLFNSGVDPKSGNNLFHSPAGLPVLAAKVKGRIDSYKTPADLHAANGLEAGSQAKDPQFKGIPVSQFISTLPTKSTPNTLYFEPKKNNESYPIMFSKLAAGDTVEINMDGVPRKITAKGTDSITIDPALPAAPFREIVVWNWGKMTDLKLDLSSPIAGGKGQPGAPINVGAYQRGELDGSGKRSLPELSEEAKTAWPDPSNYIYPCRIPPFEGGKSK